MIEKDHGQLIAGTISSSWRQSNEAAKSSTFPSPNIQKNSKSPNAKSAEPAFPNFEHRVPWNLGFGAFQNSTTPTLHYSISSPYAKKPPLESFRGGFRGGNCRYVIPNDSSVGRSIADVM
jgi:hypothetical protein